MVKRVPENMRHGWSFFDKSAAMKIEDYEQVLTSTAEGKGNWQQILESSSVSDLKDSNLYLALSPRQRLIMSLKTRGLNAKEISNELGISYTYVRQEISRAYAVLVPSPEQKSDIKALALMKYLEITKSA
jgi:DNA-binding NarL/FixJ family response regulator